MMIGDIDGWSPYYGGTRCKLVVVKELLHDERSSLGDNAVSSCECVKIRSRFWALD